MKKVYLILGGTKYEVHFKMMDYGSQGIRVKIVSIFSTIENCISIMGFNLNDIENKVIHVLATAENID